MLFALATMSGAHVFIDRSQFPENVRRDLLESLRHRTVNHKFHYESYKQAAKWLALHEAYSPARRDESCLRIYDDAFRAARTALGATDVQLVGLGCGGGQKEARLLELFGERIAHYTPSDVSLPLVLTAREAARRSMQEEKCHAVVSDLATAEDLGATLSTIDSSHPRIITLFGILPNFEPAGLFSRVTKLLRPENLLLFSANLAPGKDYVTGVQTVLPQYDNELTHDWLLTLLLDLGFERTDGELRFTIETDDQNLCRITAHFHLSREREIRVSDEKILFRPGEQIRVFFSYRHTTETVRGLCEQHGLNILGQWLNDSAEEAVFLAKKAR